MVLSEYEKFVINTAINNEFPHLDEQVSSHRLAGVVRDFNESIRNLEKPGNSFSMVQRLFKNPTFLFADLIKNRSDELPKPTIGEIREYLIAYADSIFTQHANANNPGESTELIGWNRDELINLVGQMPNNDNELEFNEPNNEEAKLPQTSDNTPVANYDNSSSTANNDNDLRRLATEPMRLSSNSNSDDDSITIERKRRKRKPKFQLGR